MLFGAFGANSASDKIARLLYEMIVEQARTPKLYRDFKVPDTVEGRFEMIVVHIFFLLQWLKEDGEDSDEIGKKVLETFFSDMDDSLREMGVGDMTLPKKIKKLADSFYDRLYSYSQALEADDRAKMEEVLNSTVYALYEDADATGIQSSHVTSLSDYVFSTYEIVKSTPVKSILSGELIFEAE